MYIFNAQPEYSYRFCPLYAENILILLYNTKIQSIVVYPNCQYVDHMSVSLGLSVVYRFGSQFYWEKDRIYQTFQW